MITASHAKVSAPAGTLLSMWKAPAHPIFLTPSEVHNRRNRGSELSSHLLTAPQQEVGDPEQPWLGTCTATSTLCCPLGVEGT